MTDPPRVAAFAPGGDEVAVAFKNRVEVWVVGENAKKNPVRKFTTEAPVTALEPAAWLASTSA